MCGRRDPGGSGVTRSGIKDWDVDYSKGVDWAMWEGGGGDGGCRRIGNRAQSPAQHATLQALSSSASKSPAISPEPLRQIIVINNKYHPPPPLPDLTRLTSQGENKRPGTPLPQRLNLDQPAQPPTVCFRLLFVCLFYSKTPETATAREGYLR